MRKSFYCGIALATAVFVTLAYVRNAPSQAAGASSKDLIVLDFTGFSKCPDYAALAGKAIPFTCGGSTSTYVDKGSAGKTLTLSGKWRITCSSGIQAYSNPYTYNILMEGEGYFGPTGPWVRSPCPEKQYDYFGGNVTQHNTPYGMGLHYNIRISD